MRAFKKDIFTFKLFLIDFSFITSYPKPCPFFGSFLSESMYPKI